MKVIKLFSVSIFVMCFISCFNAGDYYEELSGEYFFRHEGENIKEILSHLPNELSVKPKVLKYSFDKNFIVAIQNPSLKEHINSIAFEIRNINSAYSKNTIRDIQKSKSIADSLIRHNLYYQRIFSRNLNYWIISHKDDSLFGPYSKEEYLIKRKELDVPNTLKLDFEE